MAAGEGLAAEVTGTGGGDGDGDGNSDGDGEGAAAGGGEGEAAGFGEGEGEGAAVDPPPVLFRPPAGGVVEFVPTSRGQPAAVEGWQRFTKAGASIGKEQVSAALSAQAGSVDIGSWPDAPPTPVTLAQTSPVAARPFHTGTQQPAPLSAASCATLRRVPSERDTQAPAGISARPLAPCARAPGAESSAAASSSEAQRRAVRGMAPGAGCLWCESDVSWGVGRWRDA